MKRWYVVHAYSGFEKSVAQALRDRIVRDGMEERFGDVLVPTEEVVEMRAGQKRRSERKFFPGYVLVQIETHEDAGRGLVVKDNKQPTIGLFLKPTCQPSVRLVHKYTYPPPNSKETKRYIV